MSLKGLYMRCRRDIRYSLCIGIILATVVLSGFVSNRQIIILADGGRWQVTTPYHAPENILKQAGIKVLATDEYTFTEDEAGNTLLQVRRAVPVVIDYEGIKTTHYTCKETVGEAVGELGYLTEWHILGNDLKEPIVAEKVIFVKNNPQAKQNTRTVSTNVGEISYTEHMAMEATAYLPGDGNGDGLTATGIVAQRGIIAVDPGIIPLGTRVYIPGYGLAIAADTGGAIRGHKIDLCMDSYGEAINFGRRAVDVYILN